MVPGLEEFLISQSRMRIVPCEGTDLRIEGKFTLDATHPSAGRITQDFQIKIVVPKAYPAALPKATEVGGFIPRFPENHVNPDHSLCLGSPYRLRRTLTDSSNLKSFFDRTLVPYLYATVANLRDGKNYVFGELKHGGEGILEDLGDELGFHDERNVFYAVALVLAKKRIANKRACPCGCGQKLSKCPTNLAIKRMRELPDRRWLKSYFAAEIKARAISEKPVVLIAPLPTTLPI